MTDKTEQRCEYCYELCIKPEAMKFAGEHFCKGECAVNYLEGMQSLNMLTNAIVEKIIKPEREQKKKQSTEKDNPSMKGIIR